MQAVRNAASHMPGSQSCWQRNWPRVFLVCALITTVLCFVSIITGLITAVIQPRLLLLSIYCLIFALLGFSAELRQFAWCRRVVYVWMKYFYFLTYYKARALFYIMFAFLLLNNRTLDVAAAIVTFVLGFMMLLVALIVDLPIFEDPREQEQKEEEFRNYYSGPPPGNAGVTAGAANDNQSTNATGYGVNTNTTYNYNYTSGPADTSAQLYSGATSAQPTTQPAKAPPSAMPAAASQEKPTYKDSAYRVSSDDEPVRREGSSTYSSASPDARAHGPTKSNNDGGAGMFTSGGPMGPGMFAPSTTNRTTGVAPPLQEAGMTRGGNTESAIRRDFAAAVASNAENESLR